MRDESTFVPADFNLREYFGSALAVCRGKRSYEVELLFELDAAKVVTETHWHHTQRETRHRNGNVTLKFTVDGLNEILHWLLTWAVRLKVLRPTELREVYVQVLAEAIKLNVENKGLGKLQECTNFQSETSIS